jgi:methyl-accepting chemotaxis protein
MKLQNLNIGKRLGLGFAAIGMMLVVMLGLSNVMLARVNDGTRVLVNNRIPTIDATARLDAENNNIAIALRNMMLNADAADRQKQVDQIMASRKTMDEMLAALGTTITTPQGREILERMAGANAAYLAGQDALLKLIAAGDDEGARSYLARELRPRLAQLKGSTAEQTKWQKELAVRAGDEAEATYRSTAWLMSIVGALALALAAVIAWWITRSITRPMLRALEVANTVAAGDLTSRIDVATRDEAGQLLQALKSMNESLAHTVGTVRVGTDTIAVAAAQVAAGSQDLSSRTEQQASALEETASSMEELTSTVKQNADNARQANKLAESASNVAARGGEVIHQVVDTMDQINASSSKITDIIGVIDGIAFQTNILALNAAVEAARAGEQGRGFAVVATEVRNLAQRSAAAAKEIKGLIGDSSGKVADGSRLVAEAGATMQEIVESVRRVTDIMAEISAASQEQTAGIEQINRAVAQMDEGTQQNAALVEEAAAASASMQEQSGKLAQAVAVFRIDGEQARAAQGVTSGAPAAPQRVLVAPQAKPAPRVAPARKVAQPAAATTKAPVASGEWEEF